MSSVPDVSCVIVAFHRPAALRRLVAALTHPRVEVVVVNVEDDPEVRQVSAVQMLPVQENVGYAAGVNLGVTRCSARVIAFMNDDILATGEDVLTLADRVRSSSADVVVPVVEGPDGEPEFIDRRPPYRLAERMQLKGQPLPAGPVPIDAAWATFVVIRADLVRSAPLPEDYFLYWEELEWFYRLRQRLTRVELVPSVRIQHFGGLKVARPDKSRLMARNAVRCVRRTRGRSAALRAWPHVVAWQSRLLLAGMLRRQGTDVVAAHLAGVRAALSAWREI